MINSMSRLLSVLTIFIFTYSISKAQSPKKYQEKLPEKEFYYNSQLRVHRFFVDGRLKKYKTFYKSGKIASEHIFSKEGWHDGEGKAYYENGNLKTLWKYQKGNILKRIDYQLNGELVSDPIIIQKLNNLKIINRELKYNRKDLNLLYARANSRVKLGNMQLAYEDIQFLESINKNKYPNVNALKFILFLKGAIFSSFTEYDKAVHYYLESANLRNPESALYNNVGNIFFKIKEYRLALKYLNKALKQNPTNPFVDVLKALIYTEKGNYDIAYAHVDTAIQNRKWIDPYTIGKKEERTMEVNRGFLYHKLGYSQKGLRELRLVIRDNPLNSYAYKNLGIIYADQGQYEYACKSFQKSKDLGFNLKNDSKELDKLINHYCIKKNKKQPSVVQVMAIKQNYENYTLEILTEKTVNYSITTFDNKLLFSGIFKGIPINVSNLEYGLYILKIKDENKVYTRRFIID